MTDPNTEAPRTEIVGGTVISIRAKVQCGGCGTHFDVELDEGAKVPEGWTLFDEAVDAVRALQGSVQGGHILCNACTKRVDDAVTEDRPATREEVERVFADDA